jgi:hypothetical protein
MKPKLRDNRTRRLCSELEEVMEKRATIDGRYNSEQVPAEHPIQVFAEEPAHRAIRLHDTSVLIETEKSNGCEIIELDVAVNAEFQLIQFMAKHFALFLQLLTGRLWDNGWFAGRPSCLCPCRVLSRNRPDLALPGMTPFVRLGRYGHFFLMELAFPPGSSGG